MRSRRAVRGVADGSARRVVEAGDPGADRRAARCDRGRPAHAHDDRPRGVGAADDRRAGDRGGHGAGAGAAARRHGQVAVRCARRRRDRPVAGPDPLRRIRRLAAPAAGGGLPGAAGARRHEGPGRRGRVRRGRVAGRPGGESRRSAAGAHRRARRDQPRGLHARRHRLLPARGSRAGRDGRRRGEGDRAGARAVRGGQGRGGRREGHRRDLGGRVAGVVPAPAGSRSRRG